MLCCYCLAHSNWNQYWSKSPVPLRSGSPQLLLYILYIQKPAAIPFLLLEQINGGGREKSTYIWQECCWQQFYACQDGALGRRVSLFSKGSRLFEMAVRQEKQLKAHTHSILLVWILLKYKLNILPSINFGVWMFRITYYNQNFWP